MRTAQQGDRVQVHYVKRVGDGSVTSSHGRTPLELTVGIDHPRLPGLGLALIGLVRGGGASLHVPPECAYGLPDPSRVHRWSRKRFPRDATLMPGEWVRVTNARGRGRLVRILEVSDKVVVVDTNHRWAGQSLDLEVELHAFVSPPAADARNSEQGAPANSALNGANGEHITTANPEEDTLLPKEGRAIAFDVDAASLASLQEGFPGWEIKTIFGATVSSLPCDWAPGPADLLVIGVREEVSETMELCRFLAYATGGDNGILPAGVDLPGLPWNLPEPGRRQGAPLLVLVSSGQETLVKPLQEAGAHSCLMLPINAKEVASMLVHARAGNQPGRHTLNLETAQKEDRWRDNGGQG